MNKEYQKLRQISTVLKKILFYTPLPPSTEVSYFLGPYCNQNITFNLKRQTKCETTNMYQPQLVRLQLKKSHKSKLSSSFYAML